MDGEAHPPDSSESRTVNALQESSPARRAPLARFASRFATLILALLVLAALAMWIAERLKTVATNDARVSADMVAVATDISGRIVEKHVDTGDQVAVGDALYSIDDREARFRLAELEADVVRLQAEIDREAARIGLSTTKSGSMFAARDAESIAARAALALSQAELETAEREFDRTQDLYNRGFATKAALDIAVDELDAARFAVAEAEADLEKTGADRNTALIEQDEVRLIEHELEVLSASLLQAQARVEGQRVVVDNHQIRSPIKGVVDELFYDVGEHSLQGFRMALLHDPDSVWIKANVKETQVRYVENGARVEIRPDSQPGRVIEGTVAQVGNLTLAEAALMPNPNATGVFTKITQRIEVRIELSENDLGLKPGTMVQVKIDKPTTRSDSPS